MKREKTLEIAMTACLARPEFRAFVDTHNRTQRLI